MDRENRLHRLGIALRRTAPALLTAGLWLQAAALPAVDGLDEPGGSGIFGFDLGAGGTDQAFACAAQSDGKIVLAGRASDDDGEGTKIAVARVGTNGLPDPTFGASGRMAIDFTAYGYALDHGVARAVIVDSLGRFLVVGTAQTTAGGAVRTFVTRLLADGSIDQTFLYNGISGGWYFSTFLRVVSTAALDRAGNLWIVGPEIANLTGGWSFLRLDPNGLEIAAETIPVDSHPISSPTAILFQPDSKPVLGGWGQQPGPPAYASFLLIRLLAGGPAAIPDTSFGFNGDGWVSLEYQQTAQLQSIALLPNLGIAVAGQAGPLAEEDLVVQRLTPDGIADGSFEEYVAFDVGGTGGDGIAGQMKMVAQSDGKIVLAARIATGDGGNVSDIGVARLLPDNQLDPSFGGLGTGKRVFGLAVPPPGTGDDGLGCLILAAGKPIVAGWGEYIGIDTDFAFRRLSNALIFSDSFESGWTAFWSSAVVF